jgi:hypothetical protein
MEFDNLDEVFPEHAQLLRDSCRNSGQTLYAVSQQYQPDAGESGAKLAIVHVNSERGGARKCLVKYWPAGQDEQREPTAHRAARRRAPEMFTRHLVDQPFEPVTLPDGGYFMFQDVAGGSTDEVRPLTNFIDDPDRIGDSYRAVTHALVEEWNPAPESCTTDCHSYLASRVKDRLQEGRGLRDWLNQHPEYAARQAHIHLTTGETVVNPFALIDGRAPESTLQSIAGMVHGDLHPGNILVRRDAPDDWYLVDLSTFQERAPLLRDPAHLVLSTVSLFMTAWDDPVAPNIADLVLADARNRGRLPGSLVAAVDAVRDTARSTFGNRGLADEYRREWPLAIAAEALVFVGRRHLPLWKRTWFAELAARAATVYEQPRSSRPAVPTPRQSGRPHPGDRDSAPSRAADIRQRSAAAGRDLGQPTTAGRIAGKSLLEELDLLAADPTADVSDFIARTALLPDDEDFVQTTDLIRERSIEWADRIVHRFGADQAGKARLVHVVDLFRRAGQSAEADALLGRVPRELQPLTENPRSLAVALIVYSHASRIGTDVVPGAFQAYPVDDDKARDAVRRMHLPTDTRVLLHLECGLVSPAKFLILTDEGLCYRGGPAWRRPESISVPYTRLAHRRIRAIDERSIAVGDHVPLHLGYTDIDTSTVASMLNEVRRAIQLWPDAVVAQK